MGLRGRVQRLKYWVARPEAETSFRILLLQTIRSIYVLYNSLIILLIKEHYPYPFPNAFSF